MTRHNMIGTELCAGEVMICRKCKISFESTVNPQNNKPHVWFTDCRSVLFNRRGKTQCNKSEVASSISEDVDDDTSNSEVYDVHDVSDVCINDNPESITCKLNSILSKLEFQPADDKVDTTDINRRLDKLKHVTETIRNAEKGCFNYLN